ncbi:hypothetical protein TKK_0004390 [Trichogramma kaykai]
MKPLQVQPRIAILLFAFLCVGKTSAAGSLEIVTSRPYDDSLQDYNSDQNFINMNNPLSMLVYESKKINPKSTWATNVPSNAQITDRIATISPVEVVTPFRSRRGKNFKESKNVQLIFPVTQKTTTATTTTTTTTQRYEKDQEVTLPSEPLLFGFKGDGSDGKNISEMIDSQTGAAKATSTKWSDEKLPSIVQKYDRVPRPFSLTANSLNDKKRVPKKDFDKQTTTTYSYSASAPLLVPLKSLNDLENDTGQFKKSQGRLMKQSSSLIAQAINNLDNSQGSYYPGSTREIPKTTTSLPTTTQSVKISSTTITSEKTDDDLVSTTEAISEFEEVTESNEEPYSKYDDDEDYNASNGSSSNESYNNEISNHKKSAEENEDPLDNESTEIVNVTFESIERPENETQKLKTENSTDTDYDQLLGQNIQVVEKVEQSVNGSVKSNDSIAQADHKLEVKDQKESHEAREGAFDEHHDENGVEEDEKSHKDYDEHERHRDTEKGHLDKASHDREYKEKEAGRKKHDDESGYEAKREKGEKGEKKASFSEKGEHNKGHNTKGEHVVHKKDEFNKKTEFFEETHDDGSYDKEGAHHSEYRRAKGGRFDKGRAGGGEHRERHGKKAHREEGHRRERAKGHGHDSAESRHNRQHEKHGKKAREESAKKWHAKKAE